MGSRKKKVVEEPKVYLDLVTTSYCEVTRESDPDDQWSRDSTSRSWSVHGVRLMDKDGYQSIPVDFDVAIGDTVHVLYAVYSTGDSFGHDEGAHLEFISAHKDYSVATRNLQSVERRGKDEKYTMTIEFDSGAKVTRSCPWDGYFESLDYASIDTLVVQGPHFRAGY